MGRAAQGVRGDRHARALPPALSSAPDRCCWRSACALHGDGPDCLPSRAQLFVDFGGKFCKPCKAIKPFVEDLAKEFIHCRFLYIDVDELSEVALDRYGVVSLPTFKVFKWGKEVSTLTGVEGDELKEKLRAMASRHAPVLDEANPATGKEKST